MRVVTWAGCAWLMPGIGIFSGQAGDQQWHRHMAHQISVGLDTPVTVECKWRTVTATCVHIPAGLDHRLAAGRVLSIYLDALSGESRGLASSQELSLLELSSPHLDLLIGSLRRPQISTERTRQLIHQLLKLEPVIPSEPRLVLVTKALQQGMTDRELLANCVSLSPSRFSHWFVEQTGLPLRSYVKWMRLMASLQHVATGTSLTEAAHAAGFSDAAHFSRTFRTLFGIDPSSALANVSLTSTP